MMHRVPRLLILAAAALLVARGAMAQAPDSARAGPSDPRAVQPERPTVATHAHTVAPGHVEIEAGVQGDRQADESRSYTAPTVTKIGLGTHLQLNLTTPVFFAAPGQSSGLGDAAVGIKWRALDAHPLLGDFALLPAVKFPTGSANKGTGSGSTDLSLTAISSYEIGSAALDLNAIYTRVGASAGGSASNAALWTVSLGMPVAGRLSWVVELFGLPTIDGSGRSSSVALLTGPTLLVVPMLNLDAGIITPLHGGIPHSIYAGLVWNVGRLWGSQETRPH